MSMDDAARAGAHTCVTDDERWATGLMQLRHLELASLAEAATLALLVFVAVPLKHLGGWDLGVQVLGPVHGFAFVAYLWNVWQAGASGLWRGVDIARLIVCACVPLGGFVNWPWLVRKTRARVRMLAAELASTNGAIDRGAQCAMTQ